MSSRFKATALAEDDKMSEDIFKMPRMGKTEYDRLVKEEYICRIAFKGEEHPYIAPFLYVFDGRFMYFLSTNYGRKMQSFRDNPCVTVEIESYSPDLSEFSFVALPGRLVEVEDAGEKNQIRESFVNLIKSKGLSSNVLSALGHSPQEPVEVLLAGERTLVWKLAGVKVHEILGLKSHDFH
jgi:nitroimidazol reductase NimA-like FMN-containing flavoprotein (pyridoxamine 5'-phosphate oxidase superfamily)